MKCIIPGPNVKVLGRAIHSLAKLGDELYVESTAKDLSFRTVNMSKTAYASFSFGVNFFSFFSDDRNGIVKCQVSMKSSLAVFRSPLTLEKTVESCQIRVLPDSDKLVFIMKYKRGVLKTYHVRIIECESLQAYYHKDKSGNKLTLQSKSTGEILSNFTQNQDEITWLVGKDGVTMRNFCECEEGPAGVRTEIRVEKGEFEDYKIENQSEITFCLKELRAVLLFSDSVNLPLSVHFSIPGKPIVFEIDSDVFEANVVVSTLTGTDGPSQTNSQASLINKDARATMNEKQNINQTHQTSGTSLDDLHLLSNRNGCLEKVMDSHMVQQESHELVPSANSRINKQKLKQTFQNCFPRVAFNVNSLPGYNGEVLASDSGSDSDSK